MNWQKDFRGRVRLRESLSRHTTYRIGGPARFLIEPRDQADLRALLENLQRHKMRYLVLGSGSNVLAADTGTSHAVIRLNAGSFKTVAFNGACVDAGAGTHLGQLLLLCADRGLSGLEFLIGIPGTLGGALVMNAGQGVGRRCIAGVVDQVTVMTGGGRIRILKKKDIEFGYRSSRLSRYIVLSARLALTRRKKRDIVSDMDAFIMRRRLQQDWRPSCGCVFKNPMQVSAGRLIDLCGLKGRRIGGACISAKHANFIVNVNNARSSDIRALMDEMTRLVRARFGVTLEPEVKIWK